MKEITNNGSVINAKNITELLEYIAIEREKFKPISDEDRSPQVVECRNLLCDIESALTTLNYKEQK